MARSYLNHLPPEYLRYYFAAKLSDRIEDLDINFDDFTQRINSDLVGKFVNIASRSASFLNKFFSGKLSSTLSEPELYKQFSEAGNEIADKLNRLEYSQAIRQIMALADKANQYVDEKKPWSLMKEADREKEVQAICTMAVNLFRLLMIYLKPVLPQTAKASEEFLQIKPLQWQDKETPLLDHTIAEFKPLMQRIDPKQIEALKMSTQAELEKPAAATAKPEEVASEKTYINIEDFGKIDLRIAKILEANHVEGADKLLQLKVDVGDGERQIFAGIKSAYQPESLIGKHVIVVANLAPRKMRFGLSEGMVLAAGPGGSELWLVSPDEGAKPGMKVK